MREKLTACVLCSFLFLFSTFCTRIHTQNKHTHTNVYQQKRHTHTPTHTHTRTTLTHTHMNTGKMLCTNRCKKYKQTEKKNNQK